MLEPLAGSSRSVQSCPPNLPLAMVHRSYSYENGRIPTNERLEFLGDSVLGVVDHRSPLPQPSRICRRASWPRCARPWSTHIRWPRSPGAWNVGAVRAARPRRAEPPAGARRLSILADALEAVIGAVYLESGLDAVRGTSSCGPVRRHSSSTSGKLGAGLDWKTSLQELTARHWARVPRTTSCSGEGPDHARTFTAQVRVGEQTLRPRGRTHQEAGRAAGGADAPSRRCGEPSATMPELPEVEVVRRGLQHWTAGRDVRTSRCGIPGPYAATPARRPISRANCLARSLTARAAGGASSSGGPCGDRALVGHLGMSGQFRVECRARASTPESAFDLGLSRSVRRSAHLRGYVGRATGRRGIPASLRAHRARPLRPRLRPRLAVVSTIRSRRAPIKALLLDQDDRVRDREHLRRRGLVAAPRVHWRTPGVALERARVARELLDAAPR